MVGSDPLLACKRRLAFPVAMQGYTEGGVAMQKAIVALTSDKLQEEMAKRCRPDPTLMADLKRILTQEEPRWRDTPGGDTQAWLAYVNGEQL